MYPASAVMTIPGPLRLPRETVSPEVSACSRIPSSFRPDSSEAAAWPLSCAIVIAIRVIRHSRGLATMSSATAALAATTHPGGALCAPITPIPEHRHAQRVFIAQKARFRSGDTSGFPRFPAVGEPRCANSR